MSNVNSGEAGIREMIESDEALLMSVEPGKVTPLSVALTPYYRNNPYQKLLQESLKDEGAEVEFRDSIEAIAKDHQSGKRLIDILHLHWLPVLKYRPGSWLSAWRQIRALKRLRQQGVSIVWTAHNRIPHESIVPFFDQKIAGIVAANADRIIVHSEAAGREIMNACGIGDGRKIKLIHHGNYRGVYGELQEREDSRSRLGLKQEEFVFLFLGAVRPHKGVSELIDAYRTVETDARLVVAGNIKDRKFEENLRREEERMPGLKLMSGFIPDEELGRYFAAADVVVLPYQRSLTSGALILAMSFGRACIVPDFDTFTEFIDESGGFSYPAGDTVKLAQTMRAAVNAGNEVDCMGQRNFELSGQWNWSEVGKLTREVYDQAMKVASSRCI